jgi:hypothetical protein
LLASPFWMYPAVAKQYPVALKLDVSLSSDVSRAHNQVEWLFRSRVQSDWPAQLLFWGGRVYASTLERDLGDETQGSDLSCPRSDQDEIIK